MVPTGLVLLAAVTASAAPAWGQTTGQPFPHGVLPESLECSDCHTTTSWRPLDPARTFDHGEVTGFRLTGLHTAASCVSCHGGLRFDALKGAATECGSCHLDVHQGTLPADCSRCHTTEGFQLVSGIRIHQSTAFPLEGAHLVVTCESCHGEDKGGAYAPLPSDCLACHREEFEAPRTLDHAAAGFSGDCLECHTPRSFRDVRSFSHEVFSGGFQLLGSHQRLRCEACHVSGGGLLFPVPASQEECLACHLADFQREHGGGLPTTCLDCHTMNTWEDVTFDHDAAFFPINSGEHKGRWNACSDCHTVAGDYSAFSCLNCHEHSQSRMDDKHEGRAGYSYESGACLSCHPRGSEGGLR